MSFAKFVSALFAVALCGACASQPVESVATAASVEPVVVNEQKHSAFLVVGNSAPVNRFERKVYKVKAAFVPSKKICWLNSEGSGAVLRHGNRLYLVTAAHVLRTDEGLRIKATLPFLLLELVERDPANSKEAMIKSVTATDYHGTEFNCHVVAISADFDVALLSIDELEKVDPWTVSSLTERNVAKDESITLCGFTYDNYYSIPAKTGQCESSVEITYDKHKSVYCNMIYADRGVIPGFSGGPVLSDSGELLGLVSSSNFTWCKELRTYFTYFSYFVAPSTLRLLLAGR